MMNKAFELTFIPVAISILCGILITANQVVYVLPDWPLWGLLIISTIVALCVIGLVLTVGLLQWLTQWLEQHVNKQAM